MKSQEVIEAERNYELAIKAQEIRYRIKPLPNQTLDERHEATSKAFEKSMTYGDDWIDMPMHPFYNEHKDPELIRNTLILIVFTVIGYFTDEMFFGIMTMFSMCYGFIWLSLGIRWIGVFIRNLRG